MVRLATVSDEGAPLLSVRSSANVPGCPAHQDRQAARMAVVLENPGWEISPTTKRSKGRMSEPVVNTVELMKEFEDYVQKCIAAGDNFGVPINYYLKTITKSQIAQLWVAKYYPQYLGADSGTPQHYPSYVEADLWVAQTETRLAALEAVARRLGATDQDLQTAFDEAIGALKPPRNKD